MTKEQWRNQRWHRRCHFCVNYVVRHIGVENYTLRECAAKDKIVGFNSFRPFCPLYQQKLDSDEKGE